MLLENENDRLFVEIGEDADAVDNDMEFAEISGTALRVSRIAIGTYLASVYKGRVSAFYPFFPEGPLVRVHFIIARYEGETPNPDRTSLESAVAAIVRTWTDSLQEALQLVHDPVKAQVLFEYLRDRVLPEAVGGRDADDREDGVQHAEADEQLAVERVRP